MPGYQRSAEQSRGAGRRWTCGGSGECRLAGKRGAEVHRQQVEVDRIGRSVEIEVAQGKGFWRTAKIDGQHVEVQRIDGAIVIGVGGEDEEIKRGIRRLLLPRRLSVKTQRVTGGPAYLGGLWGSRGAYR